MEAIAAAILVQAMLQSSPPLQGKRSFLTVLKWATQGAIGGASFSGRVDLVGEDVFGERFANRQIEACEQLGEGFAVSAYQHRQTVVSVTGCGYTPDRFERTDRDLAVFDQLCDVG
jgi:hypothetical protein